MQGTSTKGQDQNLISNTDMDTSSSFSFFPRNRETGHFYADDAKYLPYLFIQAISYYKKASRLQSCQHLSKSSLTGKPPLMPKMSLKSLSLVLLLVAAASAQQYIREVMVKIPDAENAELKSGYFTLQLFNGNSERFAR
jgi:hypothetical protein